jgi:DNA-binding NtrC family response regulator
MPRHRTAVVADDQENVRLLIADKLAQEGYEVLEAEDGDRCLELFRERRPEVVVTDIRMPGASGEEVVSAIKEEAPTTIAIILTGFGSLDSVRRMLGAGCDGYLLKPLSNLDTVLLAIRQAQERRRMLVRNAALQRFSRNQKEVLHGCFEVLCPAVHRLQENLQAMRTCLEERDTEELGALLEAAEQEIEELSTLVEKSDFLQREPSS